MDEETRKFLLTLHAGSLHEMQDLRSKAAQSAHDRRISGADQLSDLTRNEYLQRSGSVSYREATGQRLTNESGSGRTRAETNRPHETSAAAA